MGKGNQSELFSSLLFVEATMTTNINDRSSTLCSGKVGK